MSEPKNHHLLPRFYLSGFCNKEVHESEDHDKDRSRCKVWVHDRQGDRIRERGVKKLSVERHYYSADAPGGERDSGPEKILARIEDRASRVIRALRYGSSPRPEEKVSLALFFATMKFRVSSYRSWSQDYAAEHEEDIRTGRLREVRPS